MRKLLYGLTGLLLAGGIALSANIPLFKEVQPSSLVSALNSLIVNINTQTAGLNSFIAGPITSVAGLTTPQTLAQSAIPAGIFSTAGQSLRITCGGTSGANNDAKTVGIKWGSVTISSASFSTSGETWQLHLLITAATNPVTANTVYIGDGTINTTVIAPVSGNDTTDNPAANAVTASCNAATAGTASDITLENFLVEQVK
jgi:hypothetical protein